jgi:hypothetical protein
MNKLRNFIDEQGLLKSWPSKRTVQLEAIVYLAKKFTIGEKYTENALNERLKLLHSFGDWAILRRELCELDISLKIKMVLSM